MEAFYILHRLSYQDLQRKLVKSNKIARKLGIPESVMEVVSTEMRSITSTVKVEAVNVKFTSYDVVLSGWSVIATIDHETNGKSLVYGFGRETLPEWHTCGPKCEHCNTNRYRKRTYALRNLETGEYKLVGSTCLEDFTKNKGIDQLMSWLDGVLEIGTRAAEDMEPKEEVEYHRYGSVFFNTVDAIVVAKRIIDKVGHYVSKANCDSSQISTAAETQIELFKHNDVSANEAEIEFANAVITYVAEVNVNNEYVNNLKVVLSSDTFNAKHLGFVASSVQFYLRATSAKPKEATNTVYYGKPGEKFFNIAGIVKNIRSFDSMYGTCYFVTIVDDNGHMFVWKASNPDRSIFKELSTLVISGTVKEHAEYKGVKQTIVTRVKGIPLDLKV